MIETIAFRPAAQHDWTAISALLTAARLPLDGANDHLAQFLTAWRGEQLAGVAGLEMYGEAALLRSVAVDESGRNLGFGQDLVLRLLEQAHEQGLKHVALLTTTAGNYFPRFGFVRVDRDALPRSLHESWEFQGACPATAVAMLLDTSRPPTLIRLVQAADLPAITTIYNQGIEDHSTFETELRTVEERTQWLRGRGVRHPVLVAVRGGRVLGWASLNPFSAREAYRHVADLSVYVERSSRGSGVGRVLMTALMDRARDLSYHKLVLTTFPHSIAAVRLYEKLGFHWVGDYKEQGLMDGRWTDTRLMERLLRDG